jgi:hypothetical protein
MAEPIYALMDALPEDARRDAGLLADLIVREELRAPAALGPADAVSCLRRSLEAALPDRKCAQFLLDHFASWEATVTPQSRTAFLEGLPELAPALADLGAGGMQRVLDHLNREPRLFPCIYAFAMTTKTALETVIELAAIHPLAELQRFNSVLTLSKMEESKEAERLP